MSRAPLWRPSALTTASPSTDGAAVRESPAAPTAQHGAPVGNGALAHSRAVSRHVGAGAGMPVIASSADIRTQGETGRDVGALLARMADLHEQLAQATRELEVVERNSQNRLAGAPETSELCAPVIPHELLTVDDVATLVRTSPRTIRRWRREGKLPPALHFGGLFRWRAADIERWIEERLEAGR